MNKEQFEIKKDDGIDLALEETTIQADYITDSIKCSKRVNRAKAIRLKCLDCCAYQPLEVRLCASLNCPLWRYRMGREERDNLYCRKNQKTPLIR